MSTKRVLIQKEAQATQAPVAKPSQPAEYLSLGWFPFNGAHFQEIKKRFAGGHYTNNRRQLIDDLKKDFALLTYCLRELRGAECFGDNPLKVFEVASFDEIAKVLNVSEGTVSIHGFNGLLKPQALRFKHSLISCATAEAMAENNGVDSDLAYGCALIRQLGLNLVAFNYPRIYTKALQQCADGKEDLETILHRTLGFSPRHIGAKLATKDLTPELRWSLGLDTDSTPDSTGAEIAKFCEISEAFAQLNDPEHYPAATRRWRSITTELSTFLGPNALTIIKGKLDGVADNYSILPHRIYDGDLSIERNLEVANRKVGEILFGSNPSAVKVDEDIQMRLKRAYSLMIPGQVSPEALHALVVDCVPAAGFIRGCVYLYDNSSQVLVPKLRIGERALDRYKTVQSTSMSQADNPILESLQSSVPVKRDGALMFGERVSLVSGMIGNNDKSGVLYLEMNESLAKAGGFEPVQRFKAIRHCLNLCLNLQQGPYQ